MTHMITKEFGKTKDGAGVTAFRMTNGHGMSAVILDFGGTVQSVTVPDRNGKATDVVLGYDDVRSYENGNCYYGAVVGRYANRIRGGIFELDGKEYRPGINNDGNHLHGVFSHSLFEACPDGEDLVLRYFSPDGEEGYPGNLDLEVRYRLTEDNALEILYKATTDAPTVLNLTNHSYFNLNGPDGSTVLDHTLRLCSSYYTEYGEGFVQTGRILPVQDTPLDFRKETAIGSRISEPFRQLVLCSGYDHNMILNGKEGELKPIGKAKSEKTGIVLEAFTTEPAVQFYSGNFMDTDPSPVGKNGVRYPRRGGFCLEAQHYPDSVHHPHFPSTILLPGDTYRQKTVYRLSLE